MLAASPPLHITLPLIPFPSPTHPSRSEVLSASSHRASCACIAITSTSVIPLNFRFWAIQDPAYIDFLKVFSKRNRVLGMVESLQDDCDSTLHIVTETCGKLQHCESMIPEQAKQCKLCGEWAKGEEMKSRWSNEAICGRCQFLIKEDTSGVLQTINSHSFVCYFNKHQLIIILFISN